MADWEPELELKLGCELNDGAAGCEGWLLNDGEGWDGRLNEDVGCWGRLNEEGGGREEGLEPLGEDHYARESGIQRKLCICACNQAIHLKGLMLLKKFMSPPNIPPRWGRAPTLDVDIL